MKIVFGVMSAVAPAATVASLADALGSSHPILIHHDFSQQPEFVVARPNVAFVDEPKRTGWANWGFSLGVLKLVETALDNYDFDYFQLLTPVCLPIRPIAEFEDYLDRTRADYYQSIGKIRNDLPILSSQGYRAYARENSLRYKILRRARGWMLGPNPVMENRLTLAYPVSPMVSGGLAGMRSRIGLGLTRAAMNGIGFPHPFHDGYEAYSGGTWFGASRKGCRYLIEQAADERVSHWFSGVHMADEMMFATIFGNSDLVGAPSNHLLSRFIDARPAWLEMSNLDDILASDRFFGRKFPEDPASPIRQAIISRVQQPRRVAVPE